MRTSNSTTRRSRDQGRGDFLDPRYAATQTTADRELTPESHPQTEGMLQTPRSHRATMNPTAPTPNAALKVWVPARHVSWRTAAGDARDRYHTPLVDLLSIASAKAQTSTRAHFVPARNGNHACSSPVGTRDTESPCLSKGGRKLRAILLVDRRSGRRRSFPSEDERTADTIPGVLSLALGLVSIAVAGWLVPASVHVVAWQGDAARRVVLLASLPSLAVWLLVSAAVVLGLVMWLPTASQQRLGRVVVPLSILLLWAIPFLPVLPDHFPLMLTLAGPLRWLVAGLGVVGCLFAAVREKLLPMPTVPRRLPGPRGVFVLSVLVLLVAGAHMRRSAGLSGDEPHYLVIAHSLVADGDLRIENNHQAGDYRSFHPGFLPMHYLTRGVDGVIYSVHAPGLPTLLAPAYLLGGYRGAIVLLILIAALAATAVFSLAARLATPGIALTTWAAGDADGPFSVAELARLPGDPGLCHHSLCGALGEFNWSSQHLDDEVLRCRNGNGDGQTGRVGLRCVRLVGRRQRGVRSSNGSGRRSRGGCRVRMPLCPVACRRPWVVVGSVRAVVCRRSAWRPDRLATCPWRSGKRSRSCELRAPGCATLPVGSGEPRRLSHVSCVATRRLGAAVWRIGRRLRSGTAPDVPSARRSPSWPRTIGSGATCRTTSPAR